MIVQLHQRINHLMEFASGYIRYSRFADGLRQQLFDALQAPLPQKLPVPSSNKGALALHGVDESGILELRVGALRGDDADMQIVRERADGGQRFALGELA